MRSLRLVPYWSVHETLGVDAHNAPLKMRTRRIHLSRAVAWSCVRRHPVAGAALGSTDVEGSNPPGHRAGTGVGPARFHTLVPALPRGRSRSKHPWREGLERRRERRINRSVRPPGFAPWQPSGQRMQTVYHPHGARWPTVLGSLLRELGIYRQGGPDTLHEAAIRILHRSLPSFDVLYSPPR